MGYYLDVAATFVKFVSSPAILQTFWWWLILAAIGIVFLPLTLRLFGHFHDRGYAFSKVLGLVSLSYITWLMLSLNLLPFTFQVTVGVAAIVGLAVFMALKGVSAVREYAAMWRLALFEEALFLVCLIFWAFLRTLKPEILDIEKFMDYGFLNAALKSKFMPPPDMWFAGKPINYYYFGQFITAWLTRLSCLPSEITYNLMISTLFGLCASLSFCIGSNLVYLARGAKDRLVFWGGALSAMLVTLGGSAHAFVYMVLLKILNVLGLYNQFLMPYYYGDATRYIGYQPSTAGKGITEAPIYSFIVSDLHAHVLAIPMTLLFVGLLISFVSNLGYERRRGPLRGTQFGKLVAMGLLLGVMGMTNTWTMPVYIGVMLLTVMAVAVKERMGAVNFVALPVIIAIMLVILAVLVLWPFLSQFHSPASTLEFVTARSRLYQLAVVWGYQLLLLLGFLLAFILTRSKPSKTDWTILSLCVSAAVLVALPEIIAVKDIYSAEYQRTNTMFKFTYEAFIVLGLCLGYVAVRIIVMGQPKPVGLVARIAAVGVLVAAPTVYPLIAVRQHYRPPIDKPYHALDGLKFLKYSSPGDYGAIMWLRQNVQGQPSILESSGPDYTDNGRISMATGLPTVMGWFGHEWVWRGDDSEARERTMDVRTMYDSGDVAVVEPLLVKYDVRYIIIGDVERRQYSLMKPAALRRFGDTVYNQGGTEIIRLP